MGQRIAVLGAGPMGLAVAYQLARDGHQPVLFEADDRVGGMTACFDFGGLEIERYYHFHCISDHAFLEGAGRIGSCRQDALGRNEDGLLVPEPPATLGQSGGLAQVPRSWA